MHDANHTTARQLVLEAVQDLHAREQIVTRETLAQVTGLSLTKIDDRLKTLVEDGEVARVQRGVFVPVVQHPPARAISRTLLPDGRCKVELGDEMLTLTPREGRMLAELMAGAAAAFTAIETGHHLALLASDFNTRLRKVERLAAEKAES
ncbi:MAG: hypothetical protein QM586_11980 [Xenophilus sp.]